MAFLSKIRRQLLPQYWFCEYHNLDIVLWRERTHWSKSNRQKKSISLSSLSYILCSLYAILSVSVASTWTFFLCCLSKTDRLSIVAYKYEWSEDLSKNAVTQRLQVAQDCILLKSMGEALLWSTVYIQRLKRLWRPNKKHFFHNNSISIHSK